MPYKTDAVAIKCPFLDRRTKILPCQRERIHREHEGGMSINAISRLFGVNKRTIQFVLFPERLKKNKEHRQDRGGWQQYYDKEHNTKAQREYRKHKYDVLRDTV